VVLIGTVGLYAHPDPGDLIVGLLEAAARAGQLAGGIVAAR
jgi:hypothetical protein